MEAPSPSRAQRGTTTKSRQRAHRETRALGRARGALAAGPGHRACAYTHRPRKPRRGLAGLGWRSAPPCPGVDFRGQKSSRSAHLWPGSSSSREGGGRGPGGEWARQSALGWRSGRGGAGAEEAWPAAGGWRLDTGPRPLAPGPRPQIPDPPLASQSSLSEDFGLMEVKNMKRGQEWVPGPQTPALLSPTEQGLLK